MILALLATPAAHAQDATQDEDAAPAYAPELPADTPADIVEGAAAGRPVTTLADALRYAYWTSPTLLAQRSSAQSSDWGVAQARAAYGPKLDYALTYGWTKDRFEIAKGVYLGRRGWTSTATAVLTQPLFSFGRSFANERGARAQASYQRAVLHSAEQQALLDAVDAFVGLRRTRAAVAIAADNLSALTRELTDNQARLKAHEVTATDIQQVETRVELGRVQLLAAQRDAGSAEAAFIRMIGTRPGDLAAPPALQLPVSGLEEAYAYAEAHNPLILAAQERERASRASVEGAKADQRPRVDFQGTAALLPYSSGFSNYSDSLRQTEIKGVVTLSGPLFDSGERAARIHAAEAANDADWRLMDATLRENRAALASAWNDWQAQTSAIDNLAKAVESAQKAYDGAVLQERAGMFTTLDVLQLARELLQARSSYNEGIAGAYIAKAQVLAALGALDATWLLPDAPRHDAEKDAWRVAGKADVPLITATVRALDGLVEGPARPRPTRDPAAGTHAPAATIGVPETPAMP
ncbi:TolC family type I secretion outer membrane protein [Novosphingobium sp. SG720]|nr:TolC family type I secretion outer membrane protein [Novosphingobium sp. SG720]